MITIRSYQPADYAAIEALYRQSDLYGGQFDPLRDSANRLAAATTADPQAILVAEKAGAIIGTISLIETPRMAWLFRFAVTLPAAATVLHAAACTILAARGHQIVLIYSPANDMPLNQRYRDLGLQQGGDYTCYWQEL